MAVDLNITVAVMTVPQEAHGTVGGYAYYGCDCKRCRGVHAARMRDYRRRKADGNASLPQGQQRQNLVAKVARLFGHHRDVRAVAAEVGWGEQTVAELLAEAGVELAFRTDGRPYSWTVDEARDLLRLHRQGLGVSQIASKGRHSYNTVKRMLDYARRAGEV